MMNENERIGYHPPKVDNPPMNPPKGGITISKPAAFKMPPVFEVIIEIEDDEAPGLFEFADEIFAEYDIEMQRRGFE